MLDKLLKIDKKNIFLIVNEKQRLNWIKHLLNLSLDNY
jgi:hypothetical protein